MSDATTHLLLPYILAAQAQKHVTHNEALRLLDRDRLAIVVVGDRAQIEEPLRRTGVGPIVVLDADGGRAAP